MEIFDLVFGVDVVDFANAAFVEDGVEGVGCVACVEIAARVVAFAVDVERFVTLEEIDEFGDDFWRGRERVNQSVSQSVVHLSLPILHLFLKTSFWGKKRDTYSLETKIPPKKVSQPILVNAIVCVTYLVRTVHVVQSNHHHRQLVTLHIRPHHHLGTSLTCRVGICGMQWTVLVQLCLPFWNLSIHLRIVSVPLFFSLSVSSHG